MMASSSSLMMHLLPCRQLMFARAAFSNFNPPEYYNQKQITKEKVHDAILRYQKHKSDTGSPSAQSTNYHSLLFHPHFIINIITVAGATEKILNLVRHFAVNKKDHASWRGYQVIFCISSTYSILSLTVICL